MSRTQWLLRRSSTASGRVVDAPRRGYAFPLDTFVVDPRAYARVTGDAAFREAARGTRAAVGGVGAAAPTEGGGPHHLHRRPPRGGRRRRSPDGVARGAELVASTADVPRSQRRATALVVATRDPEAVADVVPDDPLTHVGRLDARPDSATTAGSITRPVQLKRNFGEFAVQLPYGANWIDIDPGWVRRNIVTRSVPILGAVTCHRAMIAPLRRALGRLQRQGLSRLVDRGDYAGCFAARRIADSGSLSLHAWGLAVDINAEREPAGQQAAAGPPRRPRVRERRLHLGRPLADGARRHALRVARRLS